LKSTGRLQGRHALNGFVERERVIANPHAAGVVHGVGDGRTGNGNAELTHPFVLLRIRFAVSSER